MVWKFSDDLICDSNIANFSSISDLWWSDPFLTCTWAFSLQNRNSLHISLINGSRHKPIKDFPAVISKWRSPTEKLANQTHIAARFQKFHNKCALKFSTPYIFSSYHEQRYTSKISFIIGSIILQSFSTNNHIRSGLSSGGICLSVLARLPWLYTIVEIFSYPF